MNPFYLEYLVRAEIVEKEQRAQVVRLRSLAPRLSLRASLAQGLRLLAERLEPQASKTTKSLTHF